MRRVAVVGVPGSGKSTLARQLGRIHELPVIHLDAHFFEPGWKPRSEDEWQEIYEGLVSGERWVMDGAFAMDKALDHADTIVVLDLSRWQGLFGAIHRNLRQRRTPPADFAPGCREHFDKQFLQLLRFIWRYPRAGRVELEQVLTQHRPKQRIVQLVNRRAVRDFLRAGS